MQNDLDNIMKYSLGKLGNEIADLVGLFRLILNWCLNDETAVATCSASISLLPFGEEWLQKGNATYLHILAFLL